MTVMALVSRWGSPDDIERPALPLMSIQSMIRGLAATLLATTGFLRGEPSAGLIGSQPIYETAPFPSAHASTIVETPQGIIAAWFGGTNEGHPDVGIWLSRYHDKRWSAPVEIANGAETENPRVAAFNPVLFQVPRGPLLLFYKTGKWWGYIKRSNDAGHTWSRPERLHNGLVGPVKNKPILLADGTILAGSSLEVPSANGSGWRVHFERSRDGGATWQHLGPVNDGRKINAIQPSILAYPNNRLQALGRSRQGRLYEIWSEDDGKTWGEMSLMELPNPNSGADAVTLRDGRQLLVYNHSEVLPGTQKGVRSPLNVAVSSDGKKWLAALVLETRPTDVPEVPSKDNQFSYPAVIQSSDGLVHITYTWKRHHIQHTVLDPAKFELREIVRGEWPR